MHRQLTPPTVGPPSANYALATLSEGSGRWLHTSGIGPVRPDGTVADDLAEQAATVWSTLLALLDEAELTTTDIVSVTTYAVQGPDLRADLATIMAARDRAIGGHRCASILVPVPALATDTWRLEIAVVAAGS